LLDTIPGISRRLAEIIAAEVSLDMSRFPSGAHLACWAGMGPGNHQSAGKRLSGKTGKGSQWLGQALTEAAHGAIVYYILKRRAPYKELGGNYFDERERQAVQGRRLTARLGRKKAVVAVGGA
jgi:transposase